MKPWHVAAIVGVVVGYGVATYMADQKKKKDEQMAAEAAAKAAAAATATT